MSENKKRQPAGIPVGGQFAANEHDEAGGSLSVNHETLMRMGETREMPVSRIDFGDTTVTEDEDGKEHVSVVVPADQWGNERDYDSDEDRVQFLAHYDGVTGSATRITPNERGGERTPAYDYEVKLTNPHTGETITTNWGTVSSDSHERTPRAADVLHSMVSDAASVNGRDFGEWREDMGYEPDYEAESYGEDPHAKYRGIYDACVESEEKLQAFLGDRYDDYMWGNDDSSSLNVTFESE
jgi:hypothetical protein